MEQVHGLGTQIFQDWATLQQVLHALHYRLEHHCPWRQLGVARMEGPMPSQDMVDLRLFKFRTLMTVHRPVTWTDRDTELATRAAGKLEAAYKEVIEALPLILQARRRHPTQLAPAYAEVPHHLLCSATAAMQARGPNWRSAIMLSNTQEIPWRPCLDACRLMRLATSTSRLSETPTVGLMRSPA